MAFRFFLHGVEVTCDTLEDLKLAVTEFGPSERASTNGASTKSTVAQVSQVDEVKGSGPRKSWEAARAYAEKHKCSVREARQRLADDKRQVEAKKVLAKK